MTRSCSAATCSMTARPLAAPWTLGGYRGSAEFVAAALDAEACKAIAVSWLLDAPGSSNSIPADVLAGQGADLSADYIVAGSVRATNGVAPPDAEYRLLKPARSPEAAEAACEKARRG